jgi:hypothetical protein
MSDQFDPTEEGVDPSNSQPEPAGFESAFAEMENALSGVPEGATIVIRHSSGSPVYVPLFPDETGLSLREAINRAGLTIGVVNAYIDVNAAPIALDTIVAAGTVVTLIGQVKGGRG